MARFLGFDAIERETDYYFISYSSADQNRIIPIAKAMYNCGIPMWYDNGLKHGENWRRRLAERIGNSNGVIFFVSEELMEKDKSYVQKEYAIATEMKEKSVYIIMLDKIDPTKVSDYLCDFWAEIRDIHSIKTYQYENENGELSLVLIAQAVKDMLEDIEQSEKTETLSEINLDNKLNQMFDGVFSKDKDIIHGESVIQKKINEIKIKKYMSLIEKNKIDKSGITINWNAFVKNLIPTKKYFKSNNWLGQHFSLPIEQGVEHLVFQVGERIDIVNRIRYYTCEVMQSERNEEEKMQTFFTCNNMLENDDKIELVFLTFDTINNDLFVNMGMLVSNKVRISTRPLVQHFVNISTNINDIATSATHALKENEEVYCNSQRVITYDANIDGYLSVIIDLEKCIPVTRNFEWDAKSNSYISKVCLEADKNYFVFQIVPENDEEGVVDRYYRRITEYELAMYYKNGLYGCSKDEEKALLLLEELNEPKAWYEIAQIFKKGKFESKKLYEDYLTKSKMLGCACALYESKYNDLINKGSFDYNEDEFIVAENDNSGLGHFLIAYMLENGIIEFDDYVKNMTAFDYYCSAAKKGFKPASCRLLMNDTVFSDLDSYIDCKKTFLVNMNLGREISKLCLGAVLFFGIGGLCDKEKGMEFIKQSDCIPAFYMLKEIYSLDEEYKDEDKLTEVLLAISEYDITVYNEIASRLLDGIGCQVCDENDKLAFEYLKFSAYNTKNKTSFNNLAWCYEKGRGCTCDINKAKELYLLSGSKVAYWHLGNLFEHEDFELAYQYYKKSAEMGNKKAIKKLKSLEEKKDGKIKKL